MEKILSGMTSLRMMLLKRKCRRNIVSNIIKKTTFSGPCQEISSKYA